MFAEHNLTIVIALICFLGGIYALLAGVSTLSHMNIKIPGFYQFAILISNRFYGKDKTSRIEKEIAEDHKKAFRQGVFWILIGLIACANGVFLLLAT